MKDTKAISIVKPRTPAFGELEREIAIALETGMLTNSRFVQQFEQEMAEYLEVDHAIAVSNCTTGLIMTLSVLGLRGEILVPSFTFSATGHVCYWAGLKPVFVDCDARDWTISLGDCMEQLTSETSAILGVHTFGNPADIAALQNFASDNNLELIFDAAHGIGTEFQGKKVGSGGHASVFSLTPTKIITSGEGGIITTNDAALAAELRTFRNYGDGGNYDCRYIGLNGRMSEFNAILGLKTLKFAEDEVLSRAAIATQYREQLADVPGIQFQHILPGNRSSHKDCTVTIDESTYGISRDELADLLASEQIATRKYFAPPLHRQSAYRERGFRQSALKNTEVISARTLTLPMHSSLTSAEISRVCNEIKRHAAPSISETQIETAESAMTNMAELT